MNTPERPSPISAVLIHVTDWRAGLAWYRRAFPAARTVEIDGVDWTCLAVDGVQIEIVPADAKVSSGAYGTVVYWFADDFDVRTSELVALGATLYRGPMDIGNGVAMCQFKDPFGNLLGVRGPRRVEPRTG